MEETRVITNESIQLNQKSINDLNEIRKWTMFFSILGFVAIGLLLIVGIVMIGFIHRFIPAGPSFGPFFGIGFGLIYIIMASTYVVPVVYLFNFSRMTKKAVTEKDSDSLEKALTNLKNHYKFIGILTILVLVLYALIAIIAGVAGLYIYLHK